MSWRGWKVYEYVIAFEDRHEPLMSRSFVHNNVYHHIEIEKHHSLAKLSRR